MDGGRNSTTAKEIWVRFMSYVLTVKKDLLRVKRGYIFQQVNCQKAMNSGLAKSIRTKWPGIYGEYVRFSESHDSDTDLLGKFHIVNVAPDLYVVNLFGQLHYGYDGARYTSHAALNEALRESAKCTTDGDCYFPYKLGCDRGGGDWTIVEGLIKTWFPKATICELP